MNRLLIFDFNVEKKTAYTNDLTIVNHAHQTLKLQHGQTVLLALANFGLANGKVLEISEHDIAFELVEVNKVSPKCYQVEIAASRPPTMKKALEHGSSLGASSFKIFKASLSDKSYLQSHIYKEDALKKLISLGVSQGKSLCHIPKVEVQERKSVSTSQQKYILSPHSSKTFHSQTIDFNKELSLLIGPERGFTREEELHWVEEGYIPILISEQTLRVEIALFVALGQLEMLRLSR